MNINVGDHVEGSYMGTTFTGTVRLHRQHTINYKVFLTHVDLDSPIHIAAVGRDEDSGLVIHTAWDGSPVPPSAGDWGDTGDFLAPFNPNETEI